MKLSVQKLTKEQAALCRAWDEETGFWRGYTRSVADTVRFQQKDSELPLEKIEGRGRKGVVKYVTRLIVQDWLEAHKVEHPLYVELQDVLCRVERFRETGKATADFLMNSGIVEV